MTTHAVRIKLDATGHGTTEVEGIDIGALVSGLTVKSRAGKTTGVELQLPALDIDIDLLAEVSIPEDVCVVLRALGWTPPPDDFHLDQNAPAWRTVCAHCLCSCHSGDPQ